MNSELYRKLVDLYAGSELPSELEDAMDMAAFHDQELSHDMATLRKTVALAQDLEGPEFTEESSQRILMRIYARGGDIQPRTEPPSIWQYALPIQS